MTGHILDSDASSEMVLAQQLSLNGGILSRDWIYSTELRVMSTQLVFAPLFLLFSDWHMVRFTGAMILQGILILSYGILLRQAGADRKTFFYSAAMMLLPISVTYGRIMLYHSFYIPHMTMSFLLTGLLLGLEGDRVWKKPRFWMQLLLLGILSFLGGLSGIRQLMITHTPLLLICGIRILQALPEIRDAHDHRNICQWLLLTGYNLYAAAASFVGVMISNGVLARYYTFQDQSSAVLNVVDAGSLDGILYGFLHQFGFRRNVPMLSAVGLLSLAGVFAAVVISAAAVRKFKSPAGTVPIRKDILTLMFPCFTAVMMTVFLFAGEGYYYPLYLIFCIPWSLPMLGQLLAEDTQDAPWLLSPSLLLRLAALVLVFNGLANMAFFRGAKTFDQPYEGLAFQETNKAQQLQEPVRFLLEEGYETGYATFWEGNILTELSDGVLRPMNIHAYYEQTMDGYNYTYRDWLTSRYYRDIQTEKVFVLFPASERQLFETSDSYECCQLVYEDERHCIYDVLNPEQFAFLLTY